jgi:hypothetical protein
MRLVGELWFCLLCLLSMVSVAAGQATGTAMSGPSPWVDITAPPYSAKCNAGSGSTTVDDTAAVQSALNAVSSAGGGTLFIPPTAGGCWIKGYSQAISGASIANAAACSGGYCGVTITFTSALPSGFVAGGLINIHGVGNGTQTIFNGTYVISVAGKLDGNNDCTSGTGSTHCIGYMVPGNATDSASSVTNAVAEIGLYYVGNNLKVVGAASPPVTSGTSTSSVLTTNCQVGCSTTSNITILTTMTNSVPHIGPDIQNVTFSDQSVTGSGSAYAGLVVANTNGFNISNDGFYGFSAQSTGPPNLTATPQAGAAIVLSGAQPSSSAQSQTWVQFGKVENNHITSKIGITTQFSVSSVTFDSNSVNCISVVNTPPYPTSGTIGLDIGGLWYLTNGNTFPSATATGGENRVINQQSQNCVIGTLLGSQNNDVVEEKLENAPPYSGGTGASQCAAANTQPYCPIGLAVLNTIGSTFFAQSKKSAGGIYIDPNSTNNAIYENETYLPSGVPQGTAAVPSGDTLSTLTTLTCGTLIPCYLFNSSSLVIDPQALATTAVFGTPPGGSFAPSLNSISTRDIRPSGLDISVFGTNVALSVQGDAHGSDIFDAYTSSGAANFSLKSSGLPTVGNFGYITGASISSGGSKYGVGDVVTVTEVGGTGATFVVSSVSPTTGAVASLVLLTGGTGYTATTLSTTSTGPGSGLTITPTIGNATGTITFENGTNSNTTTIQSGAPSSNVTLTLPITAGSNGQPLLSGGGSSPMTFGTLGVASGGTGLTAGTSGGIPAFTGTGTLSSSGVLNTNVLVKGGGTGATPTNSTITDNGTSVGLTEEVLVTKISVANGTGLASTNFTIGSGWGTGASVGSIVGTDQAMQFVVTAGSSPASGATIMVTFTSSWNNPPICLDKNEGTSATNLLQFTSSSTASVLTLTAFSTPSASKTYTINVVCFDR